VLGALLLDDIHVGRIAEIISPEDFYYIPHKLVFQAIVSLSAQLKRIDIVTLQDELLKQSVLEKIGGGVFLISLQEDIPALGLLEQHATMIKEKSVLRELIRSAAGIINECYTQNN